jgi:hypothetical protein
LSCREGRHDFNPQDAEARSKKPDRKDQGRDRKAGGREGKAQDAEGAQETGEAVALSAHLVSAVVLFEQSRRSRFAI